MTTTLYHCPQCDRLHDEPFVPALGIFALCFDCATCEEWLSSDDLRLPQAA